MRDHAAELAELNMKVVGVSFDSISANKSFADKNGFDYPLLSDPRREVGMAYGAAKSDDAGFASRISYVIDEAGKIMLAYPKVSPSAHVDQVIADVRASLS